MAKISEYHRNSLWGNCRGLRVLTFLLVLHPQRDTQSVSTQYKKKLCYMNRRIDLHVEESDIRKWWSSSIYVRFSFSTFVTFFYFDSFVFGSILLYENLLFKHQTGYLVTVLSQNSSTPLGAFFFLPLLSLNYLRMLLEFVDFFNGTNWNLFLV